MKMTKVLTKMFLGLPMIVCFANSVTGSDAQVAHARTGWVSLGALQSGVLVYAGVTENRKRKEFTVGEEYETLCRAGTCEAAWSSGEFGTWVVIRNILTNQIMVLDQSGKMQWKGIAAFEPRSMFSVSRNGRKVAAIGRKDGVDSIWHIESGGSYAVVPLANVMRSERLQIGWLPSGDRHIVSDGEWTMVCSILGTRDCTRLLRGHLPALSPDGRLVAAFADEHSVNVFDILENRIICRLTSKEEWGSDSVKWVPGLEWIVLNESTRNGSRLVIFDKKGAKRGNSRSTAGRSIARMGIAVW